MPNLRSRFARVLALFCFFFSGLSSSIGFAAANKSVLQLDYNSSLALLKEMTAKGDLRDRTHAEAWIVLATIAIGAGLEKCDFPKPESINFLFFPAFDSMTQEQVLVLNRIVTSNYRSAETAQFVRTNELTPIVRAAVHILAADDKSWNCGTVASVWEHAIAYMRNKEN